MGATIGQVAVNFCKLIHILVVEFCSEAVKDASEEVKTLQSCCFSCGSGSVALEPNVRRRKGRPLLMRHRCTKCRKFTGDTYVETTSGVYVVYKIGIFYFIIFVFIFK